VRDYSRIAGKPALLSAVLLAVALPLVSCGSSDAPVSVVAIGGAGSPFEAGPRLSPAAQQVRAATAEGLVAFDESGRVIPALADRWIVIDGGQSYIFRLREGTWPDGSAIDSQSAKEALRDAVASVKATPFALDLAEIDEIRVMAGRVIEIRLTRAMPDLLQLLAQPELGLLRKGRGTGPMVLRRDGESAMLTPIAPEDRGLPAVANWNDSFRPVLLQALPAKQAVERFNQGDADVLLGGKIEDFPLARSVGLIRGTIQLDPVDGLFGLAVTQRAGFLAAPENREALAMAIDREALVAPFGVSGWTPSSRIVQPGLDSAAGTVPERWAALDMAARRARASALVTAWRNAQAGGTPLRLRIALPRGPGADTLFERLRADFQQIGIDSQRVADGAAADLRLVDAVARYPRASWFLNQLSCAAQRGLCSASADELAADARGTPDADARRLLLAEAEAELTAANVYIPFGPPIRWSLVRGEVSGFAANSWGIHPLMPMAMRPK